MPTAIPRLRSPRSWNKSCALLFFCVASCLTNQGCGLMSSEPAGKVHGVIKFKGEPVLPGTAVMFVMSSKGLGALGDVEEDGKFVLKMAGTDQIPVGTYTVSIRPGTGPEMTPEEQINAGLNKKKTVDPGDGVPQKYRVPETSGLTFEVKVGENQFDLDMTDEK
ncbi:MAG: hypothetical protein JWN70_5483 [Planctomycetaceae bacterium]|nr:hypothetical protein [Planctomycetaceae bacterium]